jgi:hypothetical protein
MQQGNKIILIIGILAIAAGVFVYFEASSFQKNAKLTDGKVVHVIGSSYTIEYVTDDGSVKSIRGSGKTHGFREGEGAKVWYSLKNPDRARVTDGTKGGKKIVFAGVFAVLLGIYPLFMRKKEKI